MKYSLLKTILKKSLICVIVLVPCVGYNAKASEIKAAETIMSDFKSGIEAFFLDKKDASGKIVKFKLKDIATKFASIVAATKTLVKAIESKSKANQKSKKYNDFLKVLKEMNTNLQEMYNAISGKYKSVLSFAFALGKVFKKYASSAHVAKLKKQFDNLRDYLTPDEETHLNNIIKTLDNLFANIPKSKIACLARVRTIYKR